MKAQLRPYQADALENIRAQFRDGRRSVLFVLPTGGGKTYTYSAIADGAARRGNRVLILEHRKELIRQASCSLASLGVKHQIVAPANKIGDIRLTHMQRFGWPMVDKSSPVAVASVQTLGRRMEWLEKFDPSLIIVDEAHHAVAGTWGRIIEASPRSKLLGVTATPVRTDGQGLGDVFDSMVLGPTMGDLISWGNLCRPRVFAPPVNFSLDGVHLSGGDYNARELAAVLDSKKVTGDAVLHYSKLAPGRPAIVFCASVEHAEHVAAEFRNAGYRFQVIHGAMDDGDRDRLIYGLADGSVQGLVSVDVISEGTDIPVAEVAIMLRATQSEGLFLQQVGRVLRPADGKEFGLVLDHVGNTLRFGMPDADREWSLEGRKRGQRKGEIERSVRVMQCPKCYAAHEPASACPSCGHIYAVQSRMPEQRAGELQEITAPVAPPAPATGKLRTIAQMKAAGISDSRAHHILAAREEKEKLQNELRGLLIDWAKKTGSGIRESWGFTMADVRKMKPKQLKASIEKLTEAMFMAPANDNKPAEQAVG